MIEFVERFGNVQVVCPFGHGEAMTIAQASQHEQAGPYIAGLAAGFEQLAEIGMSDEQKLSIVGGAALLRDEQTRSIIGLNQEVVSDPKKKLTALTK